MVSPRTESKPRTILRWILDAAFLLTVGYTVGLHQSRKQSEPDPDRETSLAMEEKEAQARLFLSHEVAGQSEFRQLGSFEKPASRGR